MLSILIPIYNFDCRNLVQSLIGQCEKLTQKYEIIAFDDASTATYQNINQDLKTLKNVHYKVLPQNVGRSKIRNLLAAAAQYEYLLFMDCDSRVVQDRYISDYLKYAKPRQVIYGGTFYSFNPPEDERLLLHWKVGCQREQMPADLRQVKPYGRFTTNNFLVPKSIFQNIQFEENLRQYGHEDTLFAFALEEKGVPILHLDNPLEHVGLETNVVFLRKSEQAIQNLVFLAKTATPVETRLYQTYLELKRWKLLGIYAVFFKLSKPFLRKNLLGMHPDLRVFDLYKLGVLEQLCRV